MNFNKLYTRLPYKAAQALLSVLVIVNAGALTACGQKTASSTADYIGIDAAKEAALKAADISADQAALLSAGLDSKNGTFYYEVVFQGNGTEYEYDIDALTGVVIEQKQTPLQSESTVAAAGKTKDTPVPQETTEPPQNTTDNSASTAKVDPDAAFSIALSHAGLTEADTTFHQVKEDIDDGKHILEVEFISSDGTEYDYELSAEDGTILSYDYDAEFRSRNTPAPDTGIIPEEQAKQTVLDRVPGASAENIVIALDEDDGRMEYEGKLLYENTEYEFKIDAYSGSLMEWEAESFSH